MQLIDAKGQRLDAVMFVDYYRISRKIAPARFLTVILHPDRYKELELAAAPPEDIELVPTVGPMGKPVMKVMCVPPAKIMNDGITIRIDSEADPSRIVFWLHGNPEIIVQNLAI